MMKMEEIENPALNITDLAVLEQKIANGSAKADDYRRLDKYLETLGITAFILKKINEFNIYSYEEYVESLKSPFRDNSVESKVRGTALGVIAALQTVLK